MKLLLPVALLAAVALAVPMPPNATTPSGPNTTAPTAAPVSFPLPTMLPNAYTTNSAYRAIYNAVANLAFNVASPVPDSCPWWLSDTTTAIDHFTTAIQNETNIAAAVMHFNTKYDVVGFNTTALINFFNASMVQTNYTSSEQRRIYESELDIIRNVNVRNDWILDYPQCFTVNTSVVAPTGMLPTPAPVGTDTFTALVVGTPDFPALQQGLQAYFALVQGSIPNFTLSVTVQTSGIIITITIVEASSTQAALAAQSLADMPVSYQTSLGISALTAAGPSPSTTATSAPSSTNAPNTNSPATSNTPSPGHAEPADSKKKFPLWIIGVIVGALLFLGLAALVISRRNSAVDNFRDTAATSDELSTQNGDYLRV
jgi:hypothetical protein